MLMKHFMRSGEMAIYEAKASGELIKTFNGMLRLLVREPALKSQRKSCCPLYHQISLRCQKIPKTPKMSGIQM